MDSRCEYTAYRLAHASHEHLHATSTTRFIGPIPDGWFESHKRSWLRPRTNYHREGQSFSTDPLSTGNVQSLASCPRWQAEGERSAVLDSQVHAQDHQQQDFAASAYSKQIADPETEQDLRLNGLPVIDLASSQICRPLQPEVSSGIGARSKGIEIPCKDGELDANDTLEVDRPSMSITSPQNGLATRESSAISTATFMTAPETLEEQARLAARLEREDGPFDGEEYSDGEHGKVPGENSSEDAASDTSTIRDHPRKDVITPQAEILHNSRATVLTNLTVDSAMHKSSSQISPISSDANSRKSLMHTQQVSQYKKNDSRRKVSEFVPDTRSVHFDHELHARERARQAQRQSNTLACPEGLELEQKTNALIQRRNNGYLNQKLLRNPFRNVKEPGELLRAERVLLRVESARKADVPDDYSDAKAHKIERRTDMHWREFVLAARENEDGHLVLSFHRNRIIPTVAQRTHKAKVKATEKIVLNPRTTRVNLYSALDKTIVIWQRAKRERRGTIIYILRPATTHASIQWYALMQTKLDLKPRPVAVINVPTINMKVQVDLGSERIEDDEDAISLGSDKSSVAASSLSSASTTTKSTTSLQINEQGQIMAGGVAITGDYLMATCLKVLADSLEWRDVLEDWKRNEKLGLCWRRYDRLEWIHGPNAKALIGQWAMQSSHELELRPKVHYATKVKLRSGFLEEPRPIEGFLIRLTSSTGRQARFGKVFYKRLYFSSHDGLLFFSKPARATPPPPPDFLANRQEDVETMLKEVPLVYDIEPYPLKDGRITWLHYGTDKNLRAVYDKVALTENARRVAQLQASDGYIDLTRVKNIRLYKKTREDIENNIRHDGDDIRFHLTGDQEGTILSPEVDGATDDLDDDRVFELVLDTGLVIRLQAFNRETRSAWMTQLADLARYWKLRQRADSAELQKLRQLNIETLQIDEEVESLVGQYANKWEVSQCVSEPQIYNFCPVAACRTIALRGLLYRKPRINATFRRHECVVSHGQLLIFNHNDYDAGGTLVQRIHQSRTELLNLKDCYVYSGVATQNEMIGTRETSDREGPGRHSLPRLYGDGWTSQDEQEALSFVIWTGRRRKAFTGVDKIDSDKKDNSVSRLGVAGKSMIWMARCRQERDLWVQILGNEIERATNLSTPFGES